MIGMGKIRVGIMGMRGIRVGMRGKGVGMRGIRDGMREIAVGMWRIAGGNEENQSENLRIRVEMINKQCGVG